MLDCLPPELIIGILSYCDAQTLHNVQLVSRDWERFVTENENSVYRAVALYHGFAEPSQMLDRASADWVEALSSGDESDLVFKGWKDFCRRRFQVEYNWDGRGTTPRTKMFRSTGKDVHRFKLDERNGKRFIITTHRGGGLRVSCMDTDAALFELGKNYVRHFAHCEYENGFLIFDRFHPHALEIWRLSNEWDGRIPASNVRYRPDAAQLNAPRRYFPPSGDESVESRTRRGSFSPWAIFTPANSPRAYRFVYPKLLVGSEWGQELYVFDVPSAKLDETIPIPAAAIPQGNDSVHINYVELGARHVFVCTPFGVLILPRFQQRESGRHREHDGGSDDSEEDEASIFLDFPSADPGLRIPQLVRHYAARILQSFGPPSNRAMHEFIVTAPRVPEQSTAAVRIGEDRQEFSAVHASPDGKDFVAITIYGLVYFVRGFERVFRGETTFSDIALRVDIGTSALNLAFDHDRTIIQTIHGLFVFNLHTSPPYSVLKPRSHPSQLPPEPGILPDLSCHQLLHFRNPLPLRLVSCVKVTRTGVWLDWSTRALEEMEGRVNPLSGGEVDGEVVNEEEEGEGAVREEHPYATRMVCKIDFAPRDAEKDVEREREREIRYLQA